MRNIREDLNHAGYSQEEVYFHKLNRELIERLKKKNRVAARRARKNQASARSSFENHNFKKAA